MDVFFPLPSAGAKAYDRARAFCDGCPVRLDCLLEELKCGRAIRTAGMRGGLTPSQINVVRLDIKRNKTGVLTAAQTALEQRKTA